MRGARHCVRLALCPLGIDCVCAPLPHPTTHTPRRPSLLDAAGVAAARISCADAARAGSASRRLNMAAPAIPDKDLKNLIEQLGRVTGDKDRVRFAGPRSRRVAAQASVFVPSLLSFSDRLVNAASDGWTFTCVQVKQIVSKAQYGDAQRNICINLCVSASLWRLRLGRRVHNCSSRSRYRAGMAKCRTWTNSKLLSLQRSNSRRIARRCARRLGFDCLRE